MGAHNRVTTRKNSRVCFCLGNLTHGEAHRHPMIPNCIEGRNRKGKRKRRRKIKTRKKILQKKKKKKIEKKGRITGKSEPPKKIKKIKKT